MSRQHQELILLKDLGFLALLKLFVSKIISFFPLLQLIEGWVVNQCLNLVFVFFRKLDRFSKEIISFSNFSLFVKSVGSTAMICIPLIFVTILSDKRISDKITKLRQTNNLVRRKRNFLNKKINFIIIILKEDKMSFSKHFQS